jgi:hypothetical protein
MKTPVEWLFDQLWETPKGKFDWYLLRAQALKMEKEQIKEARQDGINSALKGYSISNEEYYNETFKKEEQ